jgi:hypothetical protein
MRTTILAYVIAFTGLVNIVAGARVLFILLSAETVLPLEYYAIAVGMMSVGLGLVGLAQACACYSRFTPGRFSFSNSPNCKQAIDPDGRKPRPCPAGFHRLADPISGFSQSQFFGLERRARGSSMLDADSRLLVTQNTLRCNYQVTIK